MSFIYVYYKKGWRPSNKNGGPDQPGTDYLDPRLAHSNKSDQTTIPD